MEQDNATLPAPIATQSLPTCCDQIPGSWQAIDLGALDGDDWRRLATADNAQALALAARDFPVEPAADAETVRSCILGLRASTVFQEANEDEQIARVRMLRSAIRDVPARLLKAACAVYVRKSRWFPTPADLLAAIEEAKRDLPMSDNDRRWMRLRWLAERAEQAAELKRVSDDPVDPSALRGLVLRLGGTWCPEDGR